MFTALLKCCICYKSRQKRKLKSLYCLLFNRHLLLQLYGVTSQRGSMREVTESRSPKTPHLMQKNTQPTQSPSNPGALQFTRCSSGHLAEEAAHNAHASKSLQTRHTTELTPRSALWGCHWDLAATKWNPSSCAFPQMDFGTGIYLMFAERRLLFSCRKRRVLHREGEWHRIRHDAYQRRMCFRLLQWKWQKIKRNTELHHAADLCQHKRVPAACTHTLNFFSQTTPRPNPGNAIVHRSSCSKCYSSSSTNFQQDEDEAGVEPRGPRNYSRPESTKHDVLGR